ncbi:MAG TPA: hypothetical protein VEC56_00670, partial [Candidatus Krumholzibacteria bacterium]|nr:hypothetical protein [Candidatus Krumholzibacteria bacterium]
MARQRCLFNVAILMVIALAGCESDSGLLAPRGSERETSASINSISELGQGAYEFRALDVPADMGSYTSAFGNNNLGTIVGNFAAPDGSAHGFVHRLGRFIDVTVPGAGPSDRGSLADINDLGIAVGSFYDEDDIGHTYVRGPLGNIIVLPDREPDVRSCEGYGINNRGTIVGNFVDAAGVRHGYIWRLGQYATFDAPGARSTRLNAVNDRGEIAGQYTDMSSRVRGFVLRDGMVQPVEFPDAVSTRATGINNRGQITGFYNNDDGVWHGFVCSDGQYAAIDFPGSIDTAAF